MASKAAQKRPRQAVIRTKFAPQRRNQPRCSTLVHDHYWMAANGALFSIALNLTLAAGD